MDSSQVDTSSGLLVDRGRTAMFRGELSRPVGLAMAQGILSLEHSFFDYGCGRGTDVARLQQLGANASGWDPVHASDEVKRTADVVNLGYVVNVIEDPSERAATLLDAWRLATRVLIVSARLDWDVSVNQALPHRDGVITARGTFQKFFTQDELREWIKETLDLEPAAAGPGTFYVFRDIKARESYLARGVRRTHARVLASPALALERNRELLEPLLEFLATHGRAPESDELKTFSAIVTTFGSVARAVRLLASTMDSRLWEDAALARQRDLLVYFALGTFRRRPPLKSLSPDLRADIKAFMGSYAEANRLGRELLFALSQQSAISTECQESPVGKLTAEALYVHVSAVPELPVLLRAYEGCARQLLGDVPDATLVKLRRDKPKVSYLCYPSFDTDAHPGLAETFVADLRKLRTRRISYKERDNPPILHRKELFVSPQYTNREIFAALSAAEEAAGLLDDTSRIGTRAEWGARLNAAGYVIVDHTLGSLETGRGHV